MNKKSITVTFIIQFTCWGIIPARRVGFYTGNDGAVAMMGENGYLLFDAAISWLAGN